MSRLITFIFGAAAGAAAAHFLDPDSGRRRRHMARDQALSTARGAGADAIRKADYAAGKAKGAASSATPSATRLEDADDVTLARKVETEIFRDAGAPKGAVSVDVQAGVAYLRGMVADQEWIDRLGAEAAKVDGIQAVKNLLHRPGTPAPSPEPRGAIAD